MFGLAAIAAVAAMAFIGASSASAASTQLCNELSVGTGCAAPTTAVHFTNATVSRLLNSTIEVTCPASTGVLFASTVGGVGALGTPAQTIKGHFTYTGCSSSVGSCEVKEVSKEAILTVEKIAAEEAKVLGSAEVLVFCSGFIHCVYNGTGLKGEAKGSDKGGHVTITDQTVNRVSGALCPATAKLDLLVAPLSPIYIRE